MTSSKPFRRYVNTTAVKSKISFIDGDKGVLRYRGYPIEQLAERSNFLEVRCSVSLTYQLPLQGPSTFACYFLLVLFMHSQWQQVSLTLVASVTE